MADESPAVVNGFQRVRTVEKRYAQHAALIAKFDAITVSTVPLSRHIAHSFPSLPCAVMPNGLSGYWLDHAEHYMDTGQNRSVVAGYLPGTRSHNQDLRSIRHPLLQWLNDTHSSRLEIVGKLDIRRSDFASHQLTQKPWMDYYKLPATISRQSFTLAPLTTSLFNAGKSHIKFIESAALGVPVISSTIDDIARHHCDGLVLADSSEEWQDALAMVGTSAYRNTVSQTLIHYVRDNCLAAQHFQALLRNQISSQG